MRTERTRRTQPPRAALLGLAAVVAAAAALVAVQPLGSPWWRYADADSIYAANALNILRGERSAYYDHPGLPQQELLALTFGLDMVVRGERPQAYAEHSFADLDRTRPFYRGWAIAFFLAGAALAFFVLASVLGHWSFGLAGGLLWLAAPGLAWMSIQYRPDVPLTALALGIAYLVWRGYERLSPAAYAWAALLLGLATTLKVHAAGLAVPLALALTLRPPAPGWRQDLARPLRAFLRRRRLQLAFAGAVWLGLAVVLNWLALPWGPASSQRALAAEILGATGLLWFVVWLTRRLRAPRLERVFHPFYALAWTLVLTGVAIPATLAVGDGFIMLQAIKNALTGGGVNAGQEPFQEWLYGALDYPKREALPVFALAVAGAFVALRRREEGLLLWVVGALVLGGMAGARHGTPHYWAPAYALALVPALWIVRRRAGGTAPLALWALVAVLVASQFWHRAGDVRAGGPCADALAAAQAHAQEKDAIMLGSDLPSEGARYTAFVQGYAYDTPDLPFRVLGNDAVAVATAKRLGLTPRLFVGIPNEAPTPGLGFIRFAAYRVGACEWVELVPA